MRTLTRLIKKKLQNKDFEEPAKQTEEDVDLVKRGFIQKLIGRDIYLSEQTRKRHSVEELEAHCRPGFFPMDENLDENLIGKSLQHSVDATFWMIQNIMMNQKKQILPFKRAPVISILMNAIFQIDPTNQFLLLRRKKIKKKNDIVGINIENRLRQQGINKFMSKIRRMQNEIPDLCEQIVVQEKRLECLKKGLKEQGNVLKKMSNQSYKDPIFRKATSDLELWRKAFDNNTGEVLEDPDYIPLKAIESSDRIELFKICVEVQELTALINIYKALQKENYNIDLKGASIEAFYNEHGIVGLLKLKYASNRINLSDEQNVQLKIIETKEHGFIKSKAQARIQSLNLLKRIYQPQKHSLMKYFKMEKVEETIQNFIIAYQDANISLDRLVNILLQETKFFGPLRDHLFTSEEEKKQGYNQGIGLNKFCSFVDGIDQKPEIAVGVLKRKEEGVFRIQKTVANKSMVDRMRGANLMEIENEIESEVGEDSIGQAIGDNEIIEDKPQTPNIIQQTIQGVQERIGNFLQTTNENTGNFAQQCEESFRLQREENIDIIRDEDAEDLLTIIDEERADLTMQQKVQIEKKKKLLFYNQPTFKYAVQSFNDGPRGICQIEGEVAQISKENKINTVNLVGKQISQVKAVINDFIKKLENQNEYHVQFVEVIVSYPVNSSIQLKKVLSSFLEAISTEDEATLSLETYLAAFEDIKFDFLDSLNIQDVNYVFNRKKLLPGIRLVNLREIIQTHFNEQADKKQAATREYLIDNFTISSQNRLKFTEFEKSPFWCHLLKLPRYLRTIGTTFKYLIN